MLNSKIDPATHALDHPLAGERLATMRDVGTDIPEFRRALHELSLMVIYESTRSLPTAEFSVTTPLTDTTGRRIDPAPLIVPVLRAGLGMLGAATEMLPRSPVSFVGLRRDEHTLQPASYVNTVADDLGGNSVIILDPMLATGGSLIHTASMLRDVGAGTIIVACALAAPEGIEAYRAQGFDGPLIAGAIDDHLNEQGFIVPGLGDAGDRQFGDL